MASDTRTAQLSFPVDKLPVLDLFVIGGGINGAGIACDAAGRGLSVGLCEMGDFAGATSSASSKLIHGGLRYLEYYEFRLVREALAEREVLLRKAPHIIWPLRFVLPHEPHLRPAWMIRVGLFLYDRLGGRMSLPRSSGVDLHRSPFGTGLDRRYRKGFVYSDCWVDDARLVIFNLKAAQERGARIFARHRCVGARREEGIWRITLEESGGTRITVRAHGLVNAAGPWVADMFDVMDGVSSGKHVRLIKGSHIVVPRRHEGEHAFILQNKDGRVVFVIPYEQNYTLIGTTDIPYEGDPAQVHISAEEIDYLCAVASDYLAAPVGPQDVIWSYAGVRPLFDDGSDNPSAVTRDYVLDVDEANGKMPLLSVFGGKITTYRRLAEHALDKLKPFYPRMGPAWTHRAALPGGDLAAADFDSFLVHLRRDFPELPPEYLHILARRHGSLTRHVLVGVRRVDDLGEHFGAHLYAREVAYLMAEEWAVTAEDVLYRRTKEGLHMEESQRQAVTAWMEARRRNEP